MSKQRREQVGWWLATLALCGLALGVRLFGLNWDDGFLLHPDERFILMVAHDRIHLPHQSWTVLLDPAKSPLNPRADGPDGHPQSYAYGALPLILLKVMGWFWGTVTGIPSLSLVQLAHVGRFSSALVDTVTVLLTMLLARRLYGQIAGMLAGLLAALSVIAIQQAHFFVTDPWTTCFVALSLFLAITFIEKPSWWRAGLLGMAYGAALACKVSVAPLVVPIVVALASTARRASSNRWQKFFDWSFTAAVGALVIFALFEPYALLRPRPYLTDAITQWRIATGRIDVPYTLQYIGTRPVFYQVEQLVRWGFGPALGLASLLGLAVGIWRATRERRVAEAILVVWIIVYSASTMFAEMKFLRYLLPLVPPLLVLASGLPGWLQTVWKHRWAPVAIWGITAAVVVVTAGWAVAFLSIYTEPNTRVAASAWIDANIPAGATLGVEHWDDPLPLPLPGHPWPGTAYHQVTLTLYDVRPNDQAFAYIAQQLQNVDYIILSSDRLARSIPRVPWRYPVTSEYYRLLENGQLGFQLVYEGHVVPHLGPLQFNDIDADESFSVYDHPHVRIYRKVQQLSTAELQERFAWAMSQPWYPQRTMPDAYRVRLGQPADTLPVANDLGWSAPLTRFQLLAVLWWVIVVCGLGWLVQPLAVQLFSTFADAGYGLVVLLSLVLVGYLTWIAVALGWLPFSMPWLLLPIALVGLGSRVLLRSMQPAPTRTLSPLRWGSLAAFWGCFGLFLLLRALDPDLWHPIFGGEKPMEMAYTLAIARSLHFPPYDPWLADGTMNYYYYGFYLAAFLWKLTGIRPEVAFQLTVATFAGMLGGALFSLGATLGRWLLYQRPNVVRWAALSGAVTVYLGLLSGNLDPLAQVVQKHSLTIDFWQSSRVVTNAITEFPYFTYLWADLHPHALALPFLALLLCLLAQRVLVEAPIYRLRLDQLVLSGVAAFTAGTIMVTNTWDLPLATILLVLYAGVPLRHVAGRWQRWLGALAATGCEAGVLIVLARWLFQPFYAHFIAPVSGIAVTRFGTPPLQYLAHYGIALLVLVEAVLLWLTLREHVPWLTMIFPVVAIFGGVALTIAVSHFWPQWTPAVNVPAFLITLAEAALMPLMFQQLVGELPATWESWLILGLTSIGAGLVVIIRPTAGMLFIPALGVTFAILLRFRGQGAALFALCAAAGALWITLLADLVLVRDDLYNSPWERMNTVFKFYFEAWLLVSVAGGVAFAWLASQVWPERSLPGVALGAVYLPPSSTTDDTSQTATEPDRGIARWSFAGALLAIVLGLGYPLLGTPQRLAQRMPTTPWGSLDGFAWMNGAVFPNSRGEPISLTGDYEAIQWLRDHAQGNPVVLEASIGPYRGDGARISAATGLPDVLGWDRHERQQRMSTEVDERMVLVRQIYQETNLTTKVALLRRFGVHYIIVGDVERHWRLDPPVAGASQPEELYASAAGIDAFTQLEGTVLRRVFDRDGTIIWEVLPFPTLPPAIGETGQHS